MSENAGLFAEPQSPCSIAQAMSALVKAVRLRHFDDAVYWYTHIWQFWPKDDFRTNRRLLIISAEDNNCVPVLTTTASWYWKALKSKDREATYHGALAILYLICQTDNWWKDPNGWDYIVLWRQAEKFIKGLDESTKDLILKNGMTALTGSLAPFVFHTLRVSDKDFDRGLYAQELVDQARIEGNLPARLTAQIHASAGKLLQGDDNFLGQAVYRLHRGDLGQRELPPLDPDAIGEAKARAWKRLETPEYPQPYSQDGIHCKGKDRRFAGMLYCMVSCINAYRHYGRLDPKDEWLDEFYHSDDVPTRYG